MELSDIEMDRCFIKVFRGSMEQKSIGVKGAAYLLIPDGSNMQHLCLDKGKLQLSSKINKQSLFSFEEIPNIPDRPSVPHRYYLNNLDVRIEKERREFCVIELEENEKFQLIFEGTNKEFPFLLQYDLQKMKVPWVTTLQRFRPILICGL